MTAFNPIPLDFYDHNAWFETIINFYGDKPKFLPKNILVSPVKVLTKSIGITIDIFGNFTEKHLAYFHHTIDPLYKVGEFKRKVWKEFKDAAIKTPDPNFNHMADNLLNIRYLFEYDEEFLLTHFKEEIQQTSGANDDEKIHHFADVMHRITKIHITQIIELIKTECTV